MLRSRWGRIALGLGAVAVLLSAVTVLAVTGNREPASALKLLNGDAWLANARNGTASHVNGYTGKVDAQATIGSVNDPFQIVQRPDGAYALDLRTRRLTRLDSAMLAAGASAAPRVPGTSSGLQVVAAPSATWILDTSSGIVQQVDSSTLAPIGPQIPLGAPTSRATSDAASTLWVPVPAQGQVDAITVGGQLTRHPVGHPGDRLQVADTSSGVWVVDSSAGRAQSLSVPQAHPVTFPPMTNGKAPLVSADPAAPYVVMVAAVPTGNGNGVGDTTSQVLVANTTQSSLSSLTIPAGGRASQVVVSGDRAYLLDPAIDRLQTVDLTRVALLPPVAVPPGSNQLVSKDQLVFVNAANSPQAVVVNATSGQVTPITKYVPAAPGPASSGPHTQTANTPQSNPNAPSSSPSGGPITPQPPTGNQRGFNPGAQAPSTAPLAPTTTPVRVPPSIPPPVTPPPARPVVTPPPPPVQPPPKPAPPPPTPPPPPHAAPPPKVPPSVPSAPAIATVTGGYQNVTVTWAPPAVLGGSAVKQYNLSATVSGKVYTATAAGTATSAKMPIPADGVQVCPKISATNNTGTSPASGGTKCASTSTLAGVTGLTVHASGTTVTASWNRVANATRYRVSVTGGSSATVSGTSYTFTGSAWTAYNVTVAASDGVSTGPPSTQGPAYTGGSTKTVTKCYYTLDGAINPSLASNCGDVYGTGPGGSGAWQPQGSMPFHYFPGQSSETNEVLCRYWATAEGSNGYDIKSSPAACNNRPASETPGMQAWVSSKKYPGLIELGVYQGWTGGSNSHNAYEIWPIGQQPSGFALIGPTFYTPQ